MLRIAVCDDDKNAAAENGETVRKCLSQLRMTGETVIYSSGENLLSDVADDGYFYDLILLDIEMPGITGMELAEKIRPCLPDVKIIFITSHIEYAIDAFELSVFRYVPKDDMERRLPAAVCDALRLIALEDGRVYTIHEGGRLEKIPYREIYYIEREGKNAVITFSGGTSRVRRSLQQIYEELGAEEFIFTDRGCIVNLIHIMQIRDGTAVLKNGALLPVSRSHLKEVKEQINMYWGSHI